jgi:preprotein translocase SecE subunit
MREQAETARTEAAKEKPQRLSKARGAAAKPFKRVKLPSNRVTRGIKKALKWLVPRYFVNSWREVKQVTWPSRRETWRLTGAVFVFALVFGALVAAVDKGLDEIFKKVILK